ARGGDEIGAWPRAARRGLRGRAGAAGLLDEGMERARRPAGAPGHGLDLVHDVVRDRLGERRRAGAHLERPLSARDSRRPVEAGGRVLAGEVLPAARVVAVARRADVEVAFESRPEKQSRRPFGVRRLPGAEGQERNRGKGSQELSGAHASLRYTTPQRRPAVPGAAPAWSVRTTKEIQGGPYTPSCQGSPGFALGKPDQICKSSVHCSSGYDAAL